MPTTSHFPNTFLLLITIDHASIGTDSSMPQTFSETPCSTLKNQKNSQSKATQRNKNSVVQGKPTYPPSLTYQQISSVHETAKRHQSISTKISVSEDRLSSGANPKDRDLMTNTYQVNIARLPLLSWDHPCPYWNGLDHLCHWSGTWNYLDTHQSCLIELKEVGMTQ